MATLLVKHSVFLSHYLIPVIGPRPKLHLALLDVEGEELDVDDAGRLVDGGGLPHHQPVWVQRGLRHQRHLIVAVRAVTDNFTRLDNITPF